MYECKGSTICNNSIRNHGFCAITKYKKIIQNVPPSFYLYIHCYKPTIFFLISSQVSLERSRRWVSTYQHSLNHHSSQPKLTASPTPTLLAENEPNDRLWTYFWLPIKCGCFFIKSVGIKSKDSPFSTILMKKGKLRNFCNRKLSPPQIKIDIFFFKICYKIVTIDLR